MDAFKPRPLSRRSFLGSVAAVAGLAVTGCASQPQSAPSAALLDLPDPYDPPHIQPLVHDPETNYAPPTNFHVADYHPPVRRYVPPANPLAIIPRSAWTNIGPNMRTIQPMDGVNLITFHHTGDPQPSYFDDFEQTARFWERIREYQRGRGFEDIGYHFGIDRAGRIWQLRPLIYRGEHVRPSANGRHIWNDHNIGVVSLGNFQLQKPTPQQLVKIRMFGHMLRTRYNLAIPQVKTHQELVATLCPGLNLQPYMVYIRSRGLM